MIHAREDYNRFQDPALEDPSLLSEKSTPIAVDEPVMLFRAQDKHFVSVMHHYAYLLLTEDKDKNSEIVAKVEEHIALAKKWQEEHKDKVKTPDL